MKKQPIKHKEVRELQSIAPSWLLSNVKTKTRFEEMILNGDSIIFINGIPTLLKISEEIFPTLLAPGLEQNLPKAVVDMGAIPHICNGADVMAPGIRRIDGEFQAGMTVLVVDERHGKPIAVCKALYDSTATKDTKHGKVLDTIHYAGDKYWEAMKPKV